VSATFWVWLSISLYIVVGLVISLAARRRLGAGVSDFFLANRQVGGFVCALTYSATTYSAFMMIGLAGLTYFYGVGALGFELTYLVGIFMMVFFLPRFWLAGKKYGYISPMELLADRYQSKAVGVTTAVLALIFLVPYGAVQLMGVGFLVNGISEGAIPVWAGILVATLCALAWSYIAGLRSVAWTDAFQALVMILVSAVVLGVVISFLGGLHSFITRLETSAAGILTVPTANGGWNLNMFVGLALPWFFFLISNPQVSQRLFIPKSVTAMKQMLGGFLVFGFAFTLISVLWGFSATLLIPGLRSGDLATPRLLALPAIHGALAIVVMIGIIAAAITTIDSILLTLSSVWARNIQKGLINPALSEAGELKIGKWVIPIMAFAAFVFALWAVGKTGLNFMIAPLSAAASAGLLMAVPTIWAIIDLFFQISGLRPLGWWPGTWGAAVCLPLFIIVSLLTRPPVEKAAEFMGYLKEKLDEGNFI
jgi:SSS family solute:Na+ symporter